MPPVPAGLVLVARGDHRPRNAMPPLDDEFPSTGNARVGFHARSPSRRPARAHCTPTPPSVGVAWLQQCVAATVHPAVPALPEAEPSDDDRLAAMHVLPVRPLADTGVIDSHPPPAAGACSSNWSSPGGALSVLAHARTRTGVEPTEICREWTTCAPSQIARVYVPGATITWSRVELRLEPRSSWSWWPAASRKSITRSSPLSSRSRVNTVPRVRRTTASRTSPPLVSTTMVVTAFFPPSP